jgi:ribosomal protein S18 acetylase RimI-like enzyme
MPAGLTVRQAGKSDYSLLVNAIGAAQYVHRHLDWRDTLEWLGCQPFLILERNKEVVALLACPADSTRVAWIRSFVTVTGLVRPLECWKILFSEALKTYEEKPPIAYVALGLQDWFDDVVLKSNFHLHQRIIILEWNGFLPPKQELPQDCRLRGMTREDLPVVQQVDEKAFDPIWQNTLSDLELAFSQSPYATVIECQQAVIGYQICTSTSFGAHLARLAVNPDSQRHHLGYTLVQDLQAHYKAAGIGMLTVNTQNNNYASLALYRKMGFFQTGESFPVFIYP